MAIIIPHDFEYLEETNSDEVQTLKLLKENLSANWYVYHGIHWTTSYVSNSVFGEIDFIIVDEHANILAIEQKNIKVVAENEDLVSVYKDGKKSVTSQISRNLNNLRSEYRKRNNNEDLKLDYLLYFPNSTVVSSLPSGVDKKNVIDSTNVGDFIDRINGYFNASCQKQPVNDFIKVSNFLSQKIKVLPEIGLLGKQINRKTRRLSEGLATWGSRFSISPHRLHVRGTAGSGKTQLAFAEIQNAVKNKKTLLYVCYNRLLAENISDLVVLEYGKKPENIFIYNIHWLANEWIKERNIPFDRDNRVGFFDRMLEVFLKIWSNLLIYLIF